MAQRIEFKDEINFSVDAIMEKLLDPRFNEEWGVLQNAIDPKATMVEKTEDRAVMKLDLQEPIPGVGTISAQMTFNWDLQNHKNTWTRTAEGLGAKSNVYGSTTIIPQGDDKCLFVDEINIDVGIPLIGKKIEKGVIKHMQAQRQEKMDFLRKRLA